MASEIRANKQTNRVGLGTVTYTDTGIIVSGIVTANSLGGIGHIDVGSNIKLGNAGVITATSFIGSGAALTGIDATAIKDSAGNVKIQAQTSGAVYTGIHTFSSAIDIGSNIKIGNAGVVTATSFSGALAASNLTGALPAISGANLTDLVAGNFSGSSTGIHTISNVGVQTANMTAPDLVGAASSMVGLYIGDGHLLFSNYLNRSGGYYITTGLNALNAGPVTLGSTMTLDGAWVIV